MTSQPSGTAVLTLDYQKGILENIAGVESIIPNAVQVVRAARQNNWFLIHVGLGFNPGHPEIPDNHPIFSRVKQNNLFVKNSPSAEFHGDVVLPGELVVYKQRFSAFSENRLQLILRTQGIGHLVLMGVSTGGIVLSTLRQAFDLDFRLTVIKDACLDRDPEVHRVLTEKVFPVQADVLTAAEFLSGQKT